MAHLTLQLGAGLVVPFPSASERKVRLRDWRRRSLTEAGCVSRDARDPFWHAARPRLGRAALASLLAAFDPRADAR